jgi:hypothetical protein
MQTEDGDPEGLLAETKRRTAYHEAAHAVIGHNVGLHVLNVSMDEAHTISVRIEPEPPHLLPGEAGRRRAIMLISGGTAEVIAAGGRLAEKRFAASVMARWVAGQITGECPSLTLDVQRAATFVLEATRNHGGTAERFAWEWCAQAERMVREQWAAIEAVATSIQSRGDVGGDEFRMLIRPWTESGTLGAWPYPFGTDADVLALANVPDVSAIRNNLS